MPNIFQEVRVLRQEGKLHGKLVNRVRMMFVIAAILLCVAVYNVVRSGGSPLLSLVLAIIGFFPGLYVFSRMSPILWNEDTEIVESGAMGYLGYGILGLYIVLEIGLRTVLTNFFPVSAIAYILSLVFGLILGRGIGMVLEIHRVYSTIHGKD